MTRIKNSKLRNVFKIHTSALRKHNWNMELSQREAAKNGQLVSLAESQMIRWIDEINQTDSNALYAEVADIRRKIRWIKKDEATGENAALLRELYDRLNDLLMLREYLLVIVDSDKDYLRACQGFYLNGQHFKRLVSTSNGVKTSTIVFVSDTGRNGDLMREALMARMDNGRDMTKKFIPAKLEAYKSLVCSASIPVSDPTDVLVVPDVMTHFKADYIYLQDNPDGVGEPLYEEIHDGDCENNATDGYGLICPELMEIWSAELGLSYTSSGVCIRAPFTKGMVFCMDFVEFARNVAHTYYIDDIWGNTHNILDVQLILTESMLKLTGSYESWDEFWRNTKENHTGFSVTKTAEKSSREYRQLNYQFIAPLSCDDEAIEDLIAPTVSDIAGACGGDVDKMILYLRGENMTEGSVERMDDDWIKALMIDRRVANDPYVRNQIKHMMRRRFAKAKLGRLRAHGDFHIVGCDPYILLESVFGMKPVGLLKAGEVFSRYWIDRGAEEVVLMRAPMTILNNICRRHVSHSEDALYWYRHMPEIILINAWDLTAASLNGCDYDSDILFSTDSKVYIDNVHEQMAILCAQNSGEKVVPTEEMVIQSNMLSFGSDIGVITNRATAMYDLQSAYHPDDMEYQILQRRLAFCQKYQQDCIKG